MNLRQEAAFRLSRWLLDEDFRGRDVLPGAAMLPRVWKQGEYGEIALVPRGDAFDLYYGRDTMTNIVITRKAAIAIAKWLLFWWIRHSWCGLKHQLWNWATNCLLDDGEISRDRRTKTSAP